jgi:methionyl-tRNA formyltransferase
LQVYLDEKKNHKLDKKTFKWRGDLIICFRSHFILNEKFILKAKLGAINFHPGPPNYRGIGCVNFALLKNEKEYGATLHLIDNKIDHGAIIDFRLFKISKKDSIRSVLEKTYKIQIEQLNQLIKNLIIKKFNLNLLIKNKKWSKKLYLRKNLEQLYKIKNNITKSEFKKIIRATNTEKFKPYLIINGYKFILNG